MSGSPDDRQTTAALSDLAVRGLVLDVHRASLNDGPGLRTTVFLKGCPLRCAWCHNPESRSTRPQLGFDAARCTACRSCESACRQHVHSFPSPTAGNDARLHRIDWAACIAAGDCVTDCPSNALRLYGSERTVAEIMAEVRADRTYYEVSGGGLTLSGGEPVAQPAFSLALLRRARAEGIHTCLETCGFAPPGTFDAFRPLVDLFLFDYKATGDARHRELTGVGPDLILGNLRRLHASGASIQLRCPMIPDVNDTPDIFPAWPRSGGSCPV